MYLTQRAVPYLLAASDAVYGLASGMTVKFFPVFWIQEVQLSPMAVQAMAAAVPFLLALSSYAMHPLAIAMGAHRSAPLPSRPPFCSTYTLDLCGTVKRQTLRAQLVQNVKSMSCCRRSLLHSVFSKIEDNVGRAPDVHLGPVAGVFRLCFMHRSVSAVCCAAGRVHTILVVKMLGGLLLVWMGADHAMWRNAPLVVTVFLLRTMANNSTYALQKSILMDFVPKVPSPCPLSSFSQTNLEHHLFRPLRVWHCTSSLSEQLVTSWRSAGAGPH